MFPLPCDFKILLTVFNQSYNCQKSHCLGRNLLPNYFLLLPSLHTTIEVERHQCPLHQSILLTQGPIHEIFMKKYRELAILKECDFEKSAILNFFLQKRFFFFASFLWKYVQIFMVEWMVRNFEVFPGFQEISWYV